MCTSANSTTSHILLLHLLFFVLLFGCASPQSSIKSIDTLNDEQAMFEAFGKFAQEHPDLPESVYALYRRGEIFQKRGRFEDAKQEYARALERNAALSQKMSDTPCLHSIASAICCMPITSAFNLPLLFHPVHLSPNSLQNVSHTRQ